MALSEDLDAVCLAPLHEQARLIQGRELSPVELTRAYLERIEHLDKHLRSYLTVTAERAIDEARLAEQEIVHGASRGLLHGIPLAHKDLFDTAGVRTTAGSRVLWDNVPQRDATVIARLRSAGTVLLGKLMMYEFAGGVPYLDDDPPPALNPWGLDRTPGGSSSGSAAAVAAGLCSASLGSDTAGSIRSPAHQSGVVGLKPTYGLVSRHGVMPLSFSLDHVGPLTRSVRDAALLLQAIAGHNVTDASSSAADLPDYVSALSGDIRGLRIGIPRAFIASVPGLDPDVLAAFDASLEVLRHAGARLLDVELPRLADDAEDIYSPIMLSEALAFHRRWSDSDTYAASYGRGFRQNLHNAHGYSGADYVQAQRLRSELGQGLHDVLTSVDLLATPTVTVVAQTFREQAAAPRGSRAAFTRLFNLSGQPSLSVPCGFNAGGLPIGLLLSGRSFDELTVLRVGDVYERATPWHDRHPPMSVDHPTVLV